MINTAPRRALRLALPLTLMAISGMATLGCDERDSTVAALERARVALDAISLPSTPVGADDSAERALERVVTDLRPLTSEGSTGQKQAASLLVAQAQLGIADRRAAMATLAERESLTSLTPIRLGVDRLLAEAARSSALLSYDSAPAVAQLQELIRSKEAEIAQRQRDRAQVEGDILLLRQGAEERMAMGSAKREEAARLSVQAMSLSTQDAATLMGQIHTIRREADKIELDGADLLARAEVRQPELNEREMMVEQVVSQKAELEAALTQTRQRANDSAARAGEHAAAAAALAAELDGLIRDALQHREQTANPRVTEALEAYEAAASSARAAAGDGVALAAAAAQGQGDMHWLRGQHLQHVADLLEQLAAMPVPQALGAADRAAVQGLVEGYGARASELRRAQREALGAAAAAYEQARDLFEQVRGDDDASRARINRLTQLMDISRRGANGAAIDLSTISDEQREFVDEEAPAPTEEPAEGDDGSGADSEG